jgi:hypothetical protein
MVQPLPAGRALKQTDKASSVTLRRSGGSVWAAKRKALRHRLVSRSDVTPQPKHPHASAQAHNA